MTGIFIVARLGSTRLSQKHLIKVAGKSFIEWLTGRFATAFQQELLRGEVVIFIVTSNDPVNKKFEVLFENDPFVKVFYGADENIPLRQLQCAEANKISEIISIDGDDILCSPRGSLKILEKLLSGTRLAKTTGLPLGMNIMGYKTELLTHALEYKVQTRLETGWGRIFDFSKAEVINLGEYETDDRLRLTLDYKQDAELFTAIINDFKEQILYMDDATIINHILDRKLYDLNKDINDTYWQNFNQQKKEELEND